MKRIGIAIVLLVFGINSVACAKTDDLLQLSTYANLLMNTEKNGWETSDNGLIFYYINGVKASGWANIKGDWYFFTAPDNHLATNGWLTESNNKTGESKEYFLGADGKMYKNCQAPDGRWASEDGLLVDTAVNLSKSVVKDLSSYRISSGNQDYHELYRDTINEHAKDEKVENTNLPGYDEGMACYDGFQFYDYDGDGVDELFIYVRYKPNEKRNISINSLELNQLNYDDVSYFYMTNRSLIMYAFKIEGNQVVPLMFKKDKSDFTELMNERVSGVSWNPTYFQCALNDNQIIQVRANIRNWSVWTYDNLLEVISYYVASEGPNEEGSWAVNYKKNNVIISEKTFYSEISELFKNMGGKFNNSEQCYNTYNEYRNSK